MKKTISFILGAAALSLSGQTAYAACGDIDRTALLTAATNVFNANSSGGFHLPMWASVVDETGKVCHVVNTANGGAGGAAVGNSSWLGSRVISAQKANTANAFSLDGFAISTANLYGLVQPGGSLFGLQESNPVDATRAYSGSPSAFGTVNDPLINQRIGGVNVFGGGLALYKGGVKIGALGVSGDTSCTDHAFAWQIRTALGMNGVPNGFWKGSTKVANYVGIGDELYEDTAANSVNAAKQVTCPNPPAAGGVTGVLR